MLFRSDVEGDIRRVDRVGIFTFVQDMKQIRRWMKANQRHKSWPVGADGPYSTVHNADARSRAISMGYPGSSGGLLLAWSPLRFRARACSAVLQNRQMADRLVEPKIFLRHCLRRLRQALQIIRYSRSAMMVAHLAASWTMSGAGVYSMMDSSHIARDHQYLVGLEIPQNAAEGMIRRRRPRPIRSSPECFISWMRGMRSKEMPVSRRPWK